MKFRGNLEKYMTVKIDSIKGKKVTISLSDYDNPKWGETHTLKVGDTCTFNMTLSVDAQTTSDVEIKR